MWCEGYFVEFSFYSQPSAALIFGLNGSLSVFYSVVLIFLILGEWRTILLDWLKLHLVYKQSFHYIQNLFNIVVIIIIIVVVIIIIIIMIIMC